MVMVKLSEIPAQPFNIGVTMIFAISSLLLVFTVMKEGMESPLPLMPNPIPGLSFVQLKLLPGTSADKEMTLMRLLLQLLKSGIFPAVLMFLMNTVLLQTVRQPFL